MYPASVLLPRSPLPTALSARKLKAVLLLSLAVAQDTFHKWFMVHIGIQVTGLLLMLAAAIIALARNRPFDHHLNHFQLGVAVIALVLLQPCSAIPRLMMHHVRPVFTPHADARRCLPGRQLHPRFGGHGAAPWARPLPVLQSAVRHVHGPLNPAFVMQGGCW